LLYLVIHNFQTFSLKNKVEDYIKETLIKSETFKLKEIKNVKYESKSAILEKIIFISSKNLIMKNIKA